MKKNLLILGNVLMVLALILFVFIYAGQEQHEFLLSRKDAFENMTVAMEQVATNYLIGEQRVCDSWANTINTFKMTPDEAIEFLSASVTSPSVMAHILFTGTKELTGLTTVQSPHRTDHSVSYGSISLFRTSPDELSVPGTVNVTRTYTNPVNALQSIAFCQTLKLTDKDSGDTIDAMLLRIIPVSSFEKEWVFPTDEYARAEIALLDAEGNYILKEKSFKNTNFFEFYKSYNSTTPSGQETLIRTITGEPGTLEIFNSKAERCLLSHTRLNSTDSWTIVAMIPVQALGNTSMDWGLIGVVSSGLLLLLLFDFVIMMQFNRRFKAIADSAERANQAKTDFLSTMSHDIRTPMNAIIGLTAIAEKNMDDMTAVKDSLHKINLASSHLLTLINDILDISKVESGKLTLSPVTFSVAECTENLVNLSQPMVKEKNIDFHFRINHFDHEYLFADQLRLNQVFINLLSNAIKYTEPGGRVCVDLMQSPGNSGQTVMLTYTVADTGMGMSPEFMARMYQPFSRQTDSRVNSIQGTGLGLAITKQMVDLMGGTITCTSEVGKGTTFTVTLEIPVANKPVSEMKLPPIRVLIADDDEILLKTAKDTLLSIGAEADTADSGRQAVEMATRHDAPAYKVVILDWKMPDMNGVEAARQIRSRIGEDVPILMISAYDWSDLEQEAKAAGINGFISKPLFRSTLYEKISELLGNETSQRDQEDETADLAGMRILVAEDNDINWEIISMLLQMHGVICERAENGQIAVDRIASAEPGTYQLIFMDVQMPVLNGIEATKAIRALQKPYAASVPIIAMTADAFSENVSECLSAGMNGHIAKPIDMKLVLKEIRKIREQQS